MILLNLSELPKRLSKLKKKLMALVKGFNAIDSML
jgi:hypothetical protein